MSKNDVSTKTAEKSTEQPVEKEVETKQTVVVKPEKHQKIGLERYLQLMPQGRGICAVLRSKYAMEVKTKEDWDSTLKSILNRKIL